METAKEMTRESLPIKCLEAVILGMYPFTCLCGFFHCSAVLYIALSGWCLRWSQLKVSASSSGNCRGVDQQVAELPRLVGGNLDAVSLVHKCHALAVPTLSPALVICIMSGSDPKCPDKCLSTQSLFSLLVFLCQLLLKLGNT